MKPHKYAKALNRLAFSAACFRICPNIPAKHRTLKFPKQYYHWLKKYGFQGSMTNFWGKGRHWRITMHGEFQVGECYDDFDRWANSVVASYPNIPTTEKEFKQAVKMLLEEANAKENKNES